jgi:flagellin
MIILNSHGVGRGLNQDARQISADQQRAMERLSTGSQLRSAKDDAARFGMSENLDASSRSKRAALRNLADASALVQTAESGLGEINNILKRARELAVQSSSETLTSTERAYVQEEFAGSMQDIDNIAVTTEYNTLPLLAFASIDVGLIVDVSGSMSGEIAEVKTSIANFVTTLANSNLATEIGLAAMGDDPQDGVDRRADIADGTFGAELSSLAIIGGAAMDPYGTLYQTSGVDDISGTNDPDAFSWRAGTQQKALVILTDTFREASIYPANQATTAADMASNDIEVHTINRAVHNSYYNTLASVTGGSVQDIGNTSGSGIAAGMQNIADSLSNDYGTTSLSVQASDKSGANGLIAIDIPVNATTSGIGLTTTSVATVADAQSAIGEIDDAMDVIGGYRSTTAAATQQLNQAMDYEIRSKSDIDRGGSQIDDVDMAIESTESARQQVKAQATQSMMAQSVRIQRQVIDSLLNG